MVEDQIKHHQIYAAAIREAIPLATVEFAVDGLAALEKIEELSPSLDLVLLDLNIPKIHGSEVLAEIRKRSEFDSIPVIVVTGDSGHSLQQHLLDSGADDFIEKGCPPEIYTSRIKTQLRHRLAVNRLAEMAVETDVLTAGVLHDIKNVETTISALCDLSKISLNDDPIGNKEKIAKDLESIKGQARRISEYAASIIHNLGFKSRSQLSEIAIEPILNWVEKLLEADSEELQSTISYTISKPLASVYAEQSFLRLAIVNIIQNAVRYRSPKTNAMVDIYQTEGKEGNIITHFRDYGVGIDEKELRNIFQPFEKGPKHKDNNSGYGLGLALVSRVVRKMGGKVWASLPSDQSNGTVFSIELKKPPKNI